MTEIEKYRKFFEENTDILMKYMLWEDTILPPQILDEGVEREGDDVEFEDITFEDGNDN